MVIIFSNSFSENDPQADRIAFDLLGNNVPCKIINPNLLDVDVELIQENGDVSLVLKGQVCKPTTIYFCRMWRTDCLINLPPGCKYPSVFRSRVQQFLQDIRFAFENKAIWLPGKLESIERGESKPYMLATASRLGIKVPAFTRNGFTNNIHRENGLIYRKNLGPPFVISYNVEKKEEVGVTTLNSAVQLARLESDDQPWQWQEAIRATAQIRCFVVGDQIWSVRWQRKPSENLTDLRDVNQIQEKDLCWEPYDLPNKVLRRLRDLMSQLGLKIASPEFLVRDDGEHILIDLNPCGDWYGFFSEETHTEIVRSLVDLIRTTHTSS